jgi:hypothetical protein
MKETEAVAKTYLEKKWSVVRGVAAELLLKGEVTGDRFLEIKKAIEKRAPQVRTNWKGRTLPDRYDWLYTNYEEQALQRNSRAAKYYTEKAEFLKSLGLVRPKIQESCSLLLQIINSRTPTN